MYQIQINESRYSGVYEGGKWYALNGNFEKTPAYYLYLDGDDCDAVNFWESDSSKLIGVGETPDEALADLVRKTATPTYPDLGI
jgi:hypothetical protein